MRYLSVYVDPLTGRERLGTGADAQCPHRYASVANVIRFGLSRDAFPPGQYHVYRWPEGQVETIGDPIVAYKRASAHGPH